MGEIFNIILYFRGVGDAPTFNIINIKKGGYVKSATNFEYNSIKSLLKNCYKY